MSKLEVIQSLDEGIWRQFVDEHHLGNVFHTPEMFQVFTGSKDHQPTLWAVVNRHQTPLALILPVNITLVDGLLKQFTTRSIAYGSVLCTPGTEGVSALEKLLEVYVQHTEGKALFTELRNLSDMSNLQPILGRARFEYEDHLNYLVDLKRSPEAILQSFRSRTRKRIRRALRQDKVVIAEISDREQVALCFELIHRSYVAAGVPVADRSLFEVAFDLLYPKGMVKFLLAWVGDTCVASSVELIYKDTIYGWYSGVDRDYSAYAPNEILMWYILDWGASNGYRVYDFGGAGKPDEEYGVRDFKAKFGGELVSYGRNSYVHAPLHLLISKVGYKAYQNWNYFKNHLNVAIFTN